MATTTEDFFVRLGLDPASVSKFLQAVEDAKSKAAQLPVILEIQTEGGPIVAGIARAAQEAGTAGQKAFENFNGAIDEVEDGLNDVKGSILAISAAFGLLGGLGFAAAVTESENLARANVILGQSAEELVETQQTLRTVADDLGITYGEISEALFDVASAGFIGEDAISAVTAAAKAAVPTTATTTEAFNAIATVMRNFGLNAERAGDILVRTADITRGTLTDVAGALAKLGPTAASAGIPLEEVAAAFAAITQTGIEGQVASTLLFNALNAFKKPADEAKKALSKAGIAFGDTAFKTQDLAEKLQLLSAAAAEGKIEISDVFGNIRAARGFEALAQQSDSFAKAIEDIKDSTGRTGQGLEDFFKSAGPQFTKLRNSVINLATAVGTDLLESLRPSIQGLAEFITENQDLLKTIAKVGIAFTALVTTTFVLSTALRTYVGVTKIINGAMAATTALTAAQTGSIGFNIKLWEAKRIAEGKAALSPIARALLKTIALLKLETGTVITNLKAWALRSGPSLVAGIVAFGKAIFFNVKQLGLETFALFSNTAAQAANAAARSANARGVGLLTNALKANVSQLSLGATAAAVIGAAIIGWKLGKAIDGWLGLSDAVGKFAAGTGTSMDTVKTVIVGTLIPPLGLALATMKVLDDRAKKLQDRLSDDMVQALNETEGAWDTFNAAAALGVTEFEAFLIAQGNIRAELKILEALSKTRLLDALTLERIVELKKEVAKLDSAAGRRALGILSTEIDLQEAQILINNSTKEWSKLLKNIEGKIAKIRVGNLADAFGSVEQFEKNFNLIEARILVFSQELEAARKKLAEAVTPKGIEDATKAIEKNLGDLTEARHALENTVEITQANIIASAEAEAEAIETNTEREIASTKRLAEQTVKLQLERVQQIKDSIRELTDAQEDATNRATSFIDRLERDRLRRRDAVLAQIVDLEKNFNKAIEEGIANEETRTKLLALLRGELERLAGATRDEIRLQSQLKKVQEEIAEARVDPQQISQSTAVQKLTREQVRLEQLLERLQTRKQAAERKTTETQISERLKVIRQNLKEAQAAEERADTLSDLRKRELEIEKQLGIETAKRTKRQQAAEGIFERATGAADASLTAFAARDLEIVGLEEQRADAIQKIDNALEVQKTRQIEIEESQEKQLQNVQNLATAYTKVTDEAKKLIEVIGQAAGKSKEVFEKEVGVARARFQEAVTRAQDITLEREGTRPDIQAQIAGIGRINKETAEFMKQLGGGVITLQRVFEEDGRVVTQRSAELQQAFADLDRAFEPSQNAVADMLAATSRFAPRIESFALDVAEKTASAARRLDQVTERLTTAERKLAAVTVGGGGANGLPAE